MKKIALPCAVFFSLFFLQPILLQSEMTVNLEEKAPDIKADELSAIAQLISIQQKKLERQKDLKDQIIQFRIQKAAFMNGNKTLKHANLMVSTAKEILGMIDEEKLAYLFSFDYIEELMFFSSLAEKSRPIRPQ
ncbi:MAG: hypothetical protein FJZ57_05200 [Chlamydiae bacterium]|nr:hypothetical protein [Chlamydiota bacterium]